MLKCSWNERVNRYRRSVPTRRTRATHVTRIHETAKPKPRATHKHTALCLAGRFDFKSSKDKDGSITRVNATSVRSDEASVKSSANRRESPPIRETQCRGTEDERDDGQGAHGRQAENARSCMLPPRRGCWIREVKPMRDVVGLDDTSCSAGPPRVRCLEMEGQFE